MLKQIKTWNVIASANEAISNNYTSRTLEDFCFANDVRFESFFNK